MSLLDISLTMLAAVASVSGFDSHTTNSILQTLFGVPRPVSCPRLPPIQSLNPRKLLAQHLSVIDFYYKTMMSITFFFKRVTQLFWI